MAQTVIASFGGELTRALLEASVLHLHAYMLAEVGEVLLELRQLTPEQAGRDWSWLRDGLSALPRDRHAAPTEHQMLQFYHYAVE